MDDNTLIVGAAIVAGIALLGVTSTANRIIDDVEDFNIWDALTPDWLSDEVQTIWG